MTPKAFKKCLKDEKTAQRVNDAFTKADGATAEANITRGQLRECRKQGTTKDKKADKTIRENAILQARVKELSRDRWVYAATGAGATLATGLLLLLLTR